MVLIVFFATLVLALPLAVVAFLLGNFAVLSMLCAYTVSACIAASLSILWRRM